MFGSHLFFILCFFLFFLLFFVGGGGGGSDISIILGYKAGGAPKKISNEEAGHPILREIPIKSHKPPLAPMNGP